LVPNTGLSNLIIIPFVYINLGIVATKFVFRTIFISVNILPQHFKEHEGSSLCSQKPATGPYPNQLNPIKGHQRV
jgi:hypothetical protein